MAEIDIHYSYEHVPTVLAFADDDTFLRGLMGPFGSGKSAGCVMEIIQRAQAQAPGPDGIRRTRWAVIRNTYRQLEDTSVKTFHDWLKPGWFGTWLKSDHKFIIDRIPGMEAEILFRALDRPEHVSNLLSLELTAAWVNEAREVPWTVIQALQGRVGRYPAEKDGGCTWYGVFMDTNPPDEDSWWYRLFEERRPANARVFKQPSGIAPNAENIPNLPKNYYQNILATMDAESARAYVHGQYAFIRDGKPVFPEYTDSTHCADTPVISGLPIYRGWDFGLTPACVFTQLAPTGQWRIFDECIADNMGVDRFSNDVLAYSSRDYTGYRFIDIGDPAGAQRSQVDERTVFQILASKGIEVEPGSQSLTTRLESVRFPLNMMVDGKPAFQIDPKARITRKALQGRYQYRRLQTSQEKYSDQPDKNEYSHAADALQYVATKLFGHLIVQPRHDRGDEWEPEALGRSAVGGY